MDFSTARTFGRLRPSFITTAASVPERRRVSSASGNVPGTTVSTSSPQVIGAPARVQAPDMAVTAGTTSTGMRSFRRHHRCMKEP